MEAVTTGLYAFIGEHTPVYRRGSVYLIEWRDNGGIGRPQVIWPSERQYESYDEFNADWRQISGWDLKAEPVPDPEPVIADKDEKKS